jgi:hypothetical protein
MASLESSFLISLSTLNLLLYFSAERIYRLTEKCLEVSISSKGFLSFEEDLCVFLFDQLLMSAELVLILFA